MSDRELTPATTVKCHVCGGVSTLTHPDPVGRRWGCCHHGDLNRDSDDGPFEITGVGVVGEDFEIIDFGVVECHKSEVATREPVDPSQKVREKRFIDFEAVDIRGAKASSHAYVRDVTPSTVRSNVRDAREVLE